MNVNSQEQLKIILKGVQAIVSEEELLSKIQNSIKNNRPLNIKLGLDPSAPDIHLGHTVVLRKVRQLQDLGHNAIIVIGDFTGKIGDPTGKSKGRIALTDEQVKENAETYCTQVFKVLDPQKTQVVFNSEWLSKLSFSDVIELSSNTTVARILERDDFNNRYKNQVPISLHEFFYPLMQAYDSIELYSDIEIGGTDQTFNILMGRNMQKAYGQEEQIALFMPLLVGLDGVEKMSKSLGNYIGVNESAEIMFKKVMEIPDQLIVQYFELVTDEHPDAIEAVRKRLLNGENPRDIKYELAEIITSLYHSSDDTISAKEYYNSAFGKKTIPDNIPEMCVKASSLVLDIVPSLIEMGFIKSKSEFNRLTQQNGVQLNEQKLPIDYSDITLCDGDVIKIGKKRFIKIKFA